MIYRKIFLCIVRELYCHFRKHKSKEEATVLINGSVFSVSMIEGSLVFECVYAEGLKIIEGNKDTSDFVFRMWQTDFENTDKNFS